MLDQALDLLQRSMTVTRPRVMVVMLVLVSGTVMMIVSVLVRVREFLMLMMIATVNDLNMICADAGAENARDPDFVVDP
jgi:hypothetical protein